MVKRAGVQLFTFRFFSKILAHFAYYNSNNSIHVNYTFVTISQRFHDINAATFPFQLLLIQAVEFLQDISTGFGPVSD